MNVFISGVNGFLGGRLARYLTEHGHRVGGTSSTASGSTVRAWRLGEAVDVDWLQGTDVMIHCAHDFTGGVDINLRGTIALAKAARAAGVPKQIFVSSLSARADAAADYGRSKFAIEQQIAGADVIIVRPGTIVGPGGVFGRMCDLVRKYPVLPLVGGGHEKMYLISVSDVCRALSLILTRPSPAEFNLYYAETPMLRQVLSELSSVLGRRRVFLPVPARVLLVGLTVANAVGLRPGVDRDNLRGFRKSQIQIHASNLSSLISNPQTVQQAIAGIAA